MSALAGGLARHRLPVGVRGLFGCLLRYLRSGQCSNGVHLRSLLAAGICSIAFALFARDFLSGLILHAIVGVSLGGTYTTGVMIIADQYVPTSRGMAVGFFIASTSCGYALSLAISGVALPLGGYRLSFFVTCLGPILAWVLAWITLRHTVMPVSERREETEVHQRGPRKSARDAPHLGIQLP